MKVVILAAGVGKRFKALDIPKPLTRLANGKSILQMQLEALSAFISLDQVIVVVGYRKERIIEQFPNLLYVYNPDFSTENTSKSLLRALNKIDDDVLWLNGDVVFHPDILKAILTAPLKNRMVVNSSPVGEEEVKYRTNSKGEIIQVSKQVEQPEGEALGINLFMQASLPILKSKLELCQNDDYFEKAIELSLKDGVRVWAVPIDPLPCVEIDFPEDLKKANELIYTQTT